MGELTSADLLDLSFVSDPQVAPDGHRVAAVITDILTAADEPPRYRSRIALFDLTNDTSRTLDTPLLRQQATLLPQRPPPRLPSEGREGRAGATAPARAGPGR